MNILTVVFNGEAKIEYDRSKPLPDHQQVYLDKMDEKMDQGIPHGQGNMFAPQMEHKSQFVANQLIAAISADDEQLMAAAMAYLAIRLPTLQQVVADDKDGEVSIKLIHDQAYGGEQIVQFDRSGKLDS